MAPKKKNAPKKRAAPRVRVAGSARVANPSRGPAISHHHESMLTGLTDPFSSEASIARYPDQGAGRSLTVQARLSFIFSNSAAGSNAFAINPKASFPFLNAGSLAGQVVTWAATYDAGGDLSSNLLNTYGFAYRPTSYGVRVSNTMSATDSSGYLVIAKGGIPPLSGTTTFVPTSFTSYDVHSLEHGGEWHATGHPTSAIAYDMRAVSQFDANNEAGDPTWETIYIGLFGTKVSAPSVVVEVYLNYEYVPKEDAIIAQLASPQPVMNAPMMAAINEVQSASPSSHKGTREKVKSFLKQEAKKALFKHVLPFVEKKGLAALAAV